MISSLPEVGKPTSEPASEWLGTNNWQAQAKAQGKRVSKRLVELMRRGGTADATNRAAQVEGKLALFDRLGGEKGIEAIVDDFMPRAMQDPRVNWQRTGAKSGGLFKKQSVTWRATPENVSQVKKHLIQFIVLATGGPAQYDGKEMKAAHSGMHITNAEFDAALGDLKASLDRLQIPNKEQKELLSIVETTRPQIVAER